MNCPKCRAPLEAHEVADGVVVHHCPSCFGVLYGQETLAVPLRLSDLSPAKSPCPACKGVLETGRAYDGSLEVDRCKACGATWFDAGEIQILRRLSGRENVAGRPDPSASPDAPSVAPVAPPPAKAKSAPARPVEKAAERPARAKDDADPTEMTRLKNPDAERAPTIVWEGRTYQHFQTSIPTTTSVLGEFPWVAKVGDSAKMRDFICPPYLLSEEVTETESVWTAGEYIEPEEVWSAFGLEGAPPAKRGVAAAQPNPYGGAMGTLWGTFFLAAGLCVGAYLLVSGPGANQQAFRGGFSIDATDPEKSRVTETFELKGRTSNVAIRVETNLDMHWAYLSMALIDADTDVALDFGKEISYYHGYEDGESWSEGSGHETVIVPSVPPGRYYLRLEPETDAASLGLNVTVTRNVPLLRLPFLAFLLLLLPVLWGVVRQDNFESERWMESDHPRTSGDDGDDD